ncbi:ATP synthase complex assembly protein ATP12 [Ascoidea rubescens DSM 1968]|uniref:F1-ATP synthase assembly protein n=1 Tax=Ascoidea rubescens DSM 1968 TaxID=1344418 RepID=A0A1D2VIL0_9ASCO|nr:F1-ATP synthase assembly protein [Ascoidea rubescens DSM 1968]ODV61486.1 F1-ATP synthase assembly protein [Ascoidea rubescens DSM 1968]
MFSRSIRVSAPRPSIVHGLLRCQTNARSETNRLEKSATRFWEKVSMQEIPDPTNGNAKRYIIKLDNKHIKTPLGNPIELPHSKKTLGLLLVNEWKSLPSLKVKPYQVPLTSIVSRAVDLLKSESENNKEDQAKIGRRIDIANDLLRYLDTDTLLVFSPSEEFEGGLRKEQEETYRPLIESMEELFANYSQNQNAGPIKLNYLDVEKDGLRGNQQSEETRQAVLNFLDDLNIWEFVALEKATLLSKSFLCGVAVLRLMNNDQFKNLKQPLHKKVHYTIEQIARCATLETVYQTDRWGEVEDTHDVDKVDIVRNLSSAALVAFSPH